VRGLRVVTVMAFVALSRAAGAEAPVFRAEVASTYVDVFVSRGGQAARGLRASDFALQDNGVPQEIELVSAESRPVQAVLVFDQSSSVVGDRLRALRAAGAAFLDGLRPADEAALVAFSEEIAWLRAPTTDKAAVRAALDALQPGGATAAYDALFAALALSDPRGRSLVVLFTDGDDNMSVLDAHQLKTAADRANALVHVVGLRDARLSSTSVESAQGRALRLLAEDSGGRFWTAESPDRLRDAFAAIAASMGERYVLRYEPRGVAREGWHALTVRSARGTVQARRGYWVPTPR
jgi:VWFA-related protein